MFEDCRRNTTARSEDGVTGGNGERERKKRGEKTAGNGEMLKEKAIEGGRLWKRPRFFSWDLLAILQTNPDFNYCCAARC